MLNASVLESTEASTSIEAEDITEEEDIVKDMRQEIGVQVYASKRNARVQAKPKTSSKCQLVYIRTFID